MKKILSTFLLSAMLVLVLGGCESEEKIAADSKEQKQIERLERRVKSLAKEVVLLHACATVEKRHSTEKYPSGVDHMHYDHGRCGGSYEPKSPYASKENFDAWEEGDFPYLFEP